MESYLKNGIPVAGVAHQAGTCRCGVFPSIGAVNPPLTAKANSLRVGDRLLERVA